MVDGGVALFVTHVWLVDGLLADLLSFDLNFGPDDLLLYLSDALVELFSHLQVQLSFSFGYAATCA